MKLLLIAALAVCIGQLHAGPVASPSALVPSSDTRGQFFEEYNNLIDGITKEATESLSSLVRNTDDQLQSVEGALQDLEKLYEEKVLAELAKYDGELDELKGKVSPCFAPVAQHVREIVGGARGKAGQCATATVARVRLIEQNIGEHINAGLGRMKDIVAIGHKCLAENSWIVDQINCALQNAPGAVQVVEEIVQDAAVVLGQTSREVAKLASDTEQCLAVVVQDAVVEFNDVLGEVIDCLGEEGEQSDAAQLTAT